MLYALQPYLKYFAVLGIVPWTERRFQQMLQKIYTTAIILFNIGVAFYIVVYSPPEGDLLVSLLVSCIVFISQIVTMTVIELQVMCQYDRYYEFCLQLKCLRRQFQCELLQQVQRLPWTRYIKYFLLGALNIASVVPGVYVILHYDYIGYFWYSLSAVIINRFQCLLLLLYAELLGFHVELLGLRLKDVHNCRQLGVHSVLDVKCEQMCSLDYLLSLKRAYMELYRLFGQYNGLYGWSIVCIFVVMFLDSMINIYWALLVLAKIYNFVFIYMTFSTFVPLLILLFTFCRCGEYCKRQHMLIGSHVRGLACISQRQLEPSSQAYTAVLAEFAMQVEQDALIISAEGFMDIDYSLLMSIFTAMVTYLIVLMQFGSL
ncbi:putative gustatory receptor 39b [Drosophila nasuta]|uniref:putative gustatory receptor 39b n=1 Tax=Drosophila nasuta TaxID=42062 RepID=UPI00295ED056|nr:putative gustatory receptor 39b [Drosophila nasuta]